MKTFASKNKQQTSRAFPAACSPQKVINPPIPSHQSQIHHILYPQPIQTKLTIGQPSDKYEQEADRAAEQVMRMPEPKCPECPEEQIQTKPIAEQITPLVQRQVEEEEEIQAKLEGESKLQRQEEEEEEEEPIQTKQDANRTSEVTPGLASQIQTIRSGGRPLPEPCRDYFEPRFGLDFSQVRIHTDNQAADVAKSVNAKAFTMGRDVFFGSGQFAPETDGTKKLLGHELTHVVQQGNTTIIHKSKPQVISLSLSSSRVSRKSKTKKIVINNITFDGKQVSLSGTKSYSAKAVSGLLPSHPKAKRIDYTQPKYQHLPDRGPIREGKYYLKPSEVQCNKKSKRVKCSRIVKFATAAWGNYRTGLDESFFTKVSRHLFTKRTGGFWLHQDANHNGTAGCIGIWKTSDNEKIHYLISQSLTEEIPVQVKYPRFKKKATGIKIINYPKVHLVSVPRKWRTTRIAKLRRGTKVRILKKGTNWTKIKVITGSHVAKSGWVMNKYLATTLY